VSTSLARDLAGVLERWGTQSGPDYLPDKGPRAGLVANAVRVFALGSALEPLDRFLDRTLRGELGCGLREVLVPDLKAIAGWLPDAPAAQPACNCADCRALSLFLADPETPVARFPLAEQRRRHLHTQIERHQCDCTHQTERKGRPYTLVSAKTTASYERREKQYRQDRQLLEEIEALPEPGHK
jgi:hypothetical protein